MIYMANMAPALNLYIEKSEKELFKKLAKYDKRSMSKELEFLINYYIQKEGIKLERDTED